MCGIAGVIEPNLPPDLRRRAVDRMCAAMAHRGPDDEGSISVGPATLGMRRLAIFDPAHGKQPMQSQDGRFHLIYNGALYNFRELRAELAAHGHRFATECDTEVLRAAFGQWGESCLPRLRGMFAFAIWDAREESLFCARDPFGIKPLYYAPTGRGIVFASELRGILASGLVAADIDPQAVSESLAYLAVPAPRTLYRAVRSLRPGECAAWSGGRLGVRSYWTFRDARAASHEPCTSPEQFRSELRQRLEESVRAHSLADVPVGAFLSGGLDSSAIVALMMRQQRTPLRTFSIVFGEAEYSEAASADAVARHLGTVHQSWVLTGEQLAGDIESLVDTLDQPTGDAINTYYVSRLAKSGGVTVALSGLGGDELFGGYPWFRTTPRMARLISFWRTLPGSWRNALVHRLRSGDARGEKAADLLTHAGDLHELAALQRRNFGESSRQSLLRDPLPFTPHEELPHLRAELNGSDAFAVISAWELRAYMGDVLLRDSDVMSMSNSLELRVPFVDRVLIEWLWRQPARFKSRPGRLKAPLADAVADLLPPEVPRRPKQGFTLPIAVWMRGPLRPFLQDTFSTASVDRSGLFNTGSVQARWQAFLGRNDPREWSRVWSLALLIAFLNRRHPVAP